jgi:N-acylneuraminate cytidylyltransferase
MNRIAIIPARIGSKRIPKKNIKHFIGKPIIAYSINAAKASGLFDEIMVSTDSEEIAEVAISEGANVPFLRSAKNADDFATTFSVIEEVLTQYGNDHKYFDIGCCIYPSAPLITADLLEEYHNYLNRSTFDCVFPVLRYSYPIQRALVLADDNGMKMMHPEYIVTRSQDLEKTYHDAGQFYFFRTKALLEAKSLWTDNTGAFELNEMFAQDIDNIDDWQLAELKFKLLQDKLTK